MVRGRKDDHRERAWRERGMVREGEIPARDCETVEGDLELEGDWDSEMGPLVGGVIIT